MNQGDFNFWSLIFQGITAVGLVFFTWRQVQINRRMQELADYVAVFVAPVRNNLQFKNVGRVNLYIHKWEIGHLGETFVKPILLPADSTSQFNITLPENNGQHLIKMYLTDEKDQKYLSTGEVAVEPVGIQAIPAFPQQQGITVAPENAQQPPQGVINIHWRMRAWSHKTERVDWAL